MGLADLFRDHRTLRAVIDSVLEGRLGRIDCDDPVVPHVARLSLGCYAIFGGDAEHDHADRFVRATSAPRELLVPDDRAWRDLLHAVHGRRLSDRPMRTFSAHALAPADLVEAAARLPERFTIERLGIEATRQLDASLVPHALQVFPDAESFVAHGFGFAVLRDGVIASAATTYALSSDRAEIAIATREAFRGHGLARAVGARMLLHCLEQGRTPEWSASNPVSKRLALSLGYRPGPLCDVFYLE